MDADNQAFEAEFQEKQQSSLNDAENRNMWISEWDQPHEVTTRDPAPAHPNVNVFDYQVQSFDGEPGAGGPEMQEKGGGLLSQSHGIAPVQAPVQESDSGSAMLPDFHEPKGTE